MTSDSRKIISNIVKKFFVPLILGYFVIWFELAQVMFWVIVRRFTSLMILVENYSNPISEEINDLLQGLAEEGGRASKTGRG